MIDRRTLCRTLATGAAMTLLGTADQVRANAQTPDARERDVDHSLRRASGLSAVE
jgi:hypothetical protein